MSRILRRLLILCIAGAFGCPPSSPPLKGECEGQSTTWQVVGSDLSSALLSIRGFSKTDVYAVGADLGQGPLVLHYDGQSWMTLDTGTQGDLWWLWLESTDSIWMAGAEGRVLHYTPSTGIFEEMVLNEDQTYFGIWGSSGSHILVAGGDLSLGQDGATVWEYDGTDWMEMDLPAEASSVLAMYKVWGAGEDDVWVVGADGVSIHWDGAQWEAIDNPAQQILFTVHGSSGDDVYAVGGFTQGTIIHYDGTQWVDESPLFASQLNGVFYSECTGPMVVGRRGEVWGSSSTEWTGDPRGSATPLDYHGIWVDEEGGVWAVGGAISAHPLDQGVLVYGGSQTLPTIP